MPLSAARADVNKNIWGDQFTKLQVESFVSIVLAQLPFPPMPFRVLKGEDALDAYGSTHDLLAQALVSEQVQGRPAPENINEKKMQILKDLQKEIFGLWEVRVCSDTSKTVEACYEAFARHFRNFMKLFPGSADIRIATMEDVDKKSTVWNQAYEHMRARLSNTVPIGEEAVVLPISLNKSSSYKQIVAAYAAELHSYGCDTDV